MRVCLRYALVRIIILAVIGLALTIFDIFPEQYHLEVTIGFFILTAYFFIRTVKRAYTRGADEGVRHYQEARRRNY
jgi:hypothetical membrane protein